MTKSPFSQASQALQDPPFPPFPIDAQTLLPHKAPMCCIGQLLSAREREATAGVLLREGHVLLHNSRLEPAGFIELAAQSAGAMQGYWQRRLNSPPSLGYLAAVQNFRIHSPAYGGDFLTVHIEVLGELEGVSAIEARIYCGERLLAEGRLKVFVPPATPASSAAPAENSLQGTPN